MHTLWQLIFSPFPNQNIQDVANIYNTNTLFFFKQRDIKVLKIGKEVLRYDAMIIISIFDISCIYKTYTSL